MVSSLVSSVKGTLEAVGPDWAEVGVAGITFRVNVPGSAADQIGKIGDNVKLFTALQVREDSLTLFGFLTEESRLAFEALIAINGVGPRVALSVLSRFTPESLAAAVSSGDTDEFVGVAGVGKKTASRIVLELKGKLEGDWAIAPTTTGDWAIAPTTTEDREVIDALTSLGYSLSEAREGVATLPPGNSLSVEEKVRQILQHMGSR